MGSKNTNIKFNIIAKAYCNSTPGKIFNTAYFLVKNDPPFADHNDLIQLQKENGLDVAITLHSHKSATEISSIKHQNLKKKFMSKLTVEDIKISVIVDESTNLGKQCTLILYTKNILDGKEKIIFLGLVALENSKAEIITTQFLNCLSSYGLTQKLS